LLNENVCFSRRARPAFCLNPVRRSRFVATGRHPGKRIDPRILAGEQRVDLMIWEQLGPCLRPELASPRAGRANPRWRLVEFLGAGLVAGQSRACN
jgi:hypothetical protein